MAAITAKARASTALNATSRLSEEEVLDVIRSAAGAVKGGGASLLTTGITNFGANVSIVRETPSSLTMAITSSKQIVELCTFSATVSADGSGRTNVRVGGLETYKTQQTKVFVFVPAGPKQIYGMAPYKRFLQLVADALQASDSTATISVAQPEE